MKKLTISVDDEVYKGLRKRIGPRRVSRFLNDLARPHVVEADLADGYRRMAQDRQREQEAREWSEGLIGDVNE
jgi:hypothetical protein